MTDTRFKPIDAPEVAKEPPKRWRNWWQSDRETWCSKCYGTFPPAVAYTCCRAYVSRDVAETEAAQDELEQVLDEGRVIALYLGAFPDGEAP